MSVVAIKYMEKEPRSTVSLAFYQLCCRVYGDEIPTDILYCQRIRFKNGLNPFMHKKRGWYCEIINVTT